MHLRKILVISPFLFLPGSILFASPSWQNLGGSFQGNPIGVANDDLRLEVFVRGTDNALWFSAQTSPGGSWTPFVSLGGVIISNPVALPDTSGHIAVFALGTDGAVWRRSQITAGVDNYSDWSSIGGFGTSDLAAVQIHPQQHAPFSTAHIFVRGNDGAVGMDSASDVTSTFGTWGTIGGYTTSAPAAGLNINNQTAVFVRGGDDALWYNPGSLSAGWTSLGGAMAGPPEDAEINQKILYRGVDGAVWVVLDTTPTVGGGGSAPPSWSGPISLGGYLISNPTMPPLLSTTDLEVFGAGGDNALWVTTSSNGGPYGPWQSLGGMVVGDPFAMRNTDGTIDVFAIGADGTLSHIRQSAAGSWQ